MKIFAFSFIFEERITYIKGAEIISFTIAAVFRKTNTFPSHSFLKFDRCVYRSTACKYTYQYAHILTSSIFKILSLWKNIHKLSLFNILWIHSLKLKEKVLKIKLQFIETFLTGIISYTVLLLVLFVFRISTFFGEPYLKNTEGCLLFTFGLFCYLNLRCSTNEKQVGKIRTL